MAEWYSIVYMYHIFIHSSVDGHLCCFHALVIKGCSVPMCVGSGEGDALASLLQAKKCRGWQLTGWSLQWCKAQGGGALTACTMMMIRLWLYWVLQSEGFFFVCLFFCLVSYSGLGEQKNEGIIPKGRWKPTERSPEKRNQVGCMYINRDLFQGIGSHHSGGHYYLVNPKSTGSVGRPLGKTCSVSAKAMACWQNAFLCPGKISLCSLSRPLTDQMRSTCIWGGDNLLYSEATGLNVNLIPKTPSQKQPE